MPLNLNDSDPPPASIRQITAANNVNGNSTPLGEKNPCGKWTLKIATVMSMANSADETRTAMPAISSIPPTNSTTVTTTAKNAGSPTPTCPNIPTTPQKPN